MYLHLLPRRGFLCRGPNKSMFVRASCVTLDARNLRFLAKNLEISVKVIIDTGRILNLNNVIIRHSSTCDYLYKQSLRGHPCPAGVI